MLWMVNEFVTLFNAYHNINQWYYNESAYAFDKGPMTYTVIICINTEMTFINLYHGLTIVLYNCFVTDKNALNFK